MSFHTTHCESSLRNFWPKGSFAFGCLNALYSYFGKLLRDDKRCNHFPAVCRTMYCDNWTSLKVNKKGGGLMMIWTLDHLPPILSSPDCSHTQIKVGRRELLNTRKRDLGSPGSQCSKITRKCLIWFFTAKVLFLKCQKFRRNKGQRLLTSLAWL